MTLSTAFTRLFGIQHRIALAPMGGAAGGALKPRDGADDNED